MVYAQAHAKTETLVRFPHLSSAWTHFCRKQKRNLFFASEPVKWPLRWLITHHQHWWSATASFPKWFKICACAILWNAAKLDHTNNNHPNCCYCARLSFTCFYQRCAIIRKLKSEWLLSDQAHAETSLHWKSAWYVSHLIGSFSDVKLCQCESQDITSWKWYQCCF